MTEKEKSYAGILYQPGDPELAADREAMVKKLYEYLYRRRYTAGGGSIVTKDIPPNSLAVGNPCRVIRTL